MSEPRVVPSEARRIVAGGLGYLEAARWYGEALWFSDMRNRRVQRMLPDGEVVLVADVPQRPSGLGFQPDGTPLVISQDDEKLLRVADGALEEVADLGPVSFHPNDMAVDREGRAYISQFGYDLFAGADPAPTGLLVRHPDGRVEQCGEGLLFPNGVAISADGSTVVTAESFGSPRTRLTAFDVAAGGSLVNQRVFAEFGPTETDVVDGICIDVEGAVWTSFPRLGEYRRVRDGGEVTDVVRVEPDFDAYPDGGTYVVDSVLGGAGMRTLYMLISDTNLERLGNDFDATGRIEAVEVDVPGVRLD